MENKAKILLPNERVACVYCRIYYELDLPNSHAIVFCYSPVFIRDGPLETLWAGGGAKYKKIIRAREN